MRIKDSAEFMAQLVREGSGPGCPYPCSNQIVSNIIVCYKNDEYLQNFLDMQRAAIIRTENKKPKIVNIDNSHWTIVRCSDSARGYRSYRIWIDTRLELEENRAFLAHMMNHYCCEVNFF